MSTGNDNDSGTSSPVATTEAINLVEKRMKLLCSYGGKILPRPSDGQLKYVGGETRVVCVPRSVSFSDLSKKIEDIFKVGKIVIKYRIMNEDLDTLVSVRCNEDLVHMWEEHDRIMPLGSPTSSGPRFLRLFLFGSPSLSSVHSYLDAINSKQMDPPLNCHLEPSRDYHAESLSYCNFDVPTMHRVELPRAGRVVSSPRRNQFPRARSTPNLHGAHQIGVDGSGPSCRTQCGHVYRNPVQLMGRTHLQSCGRYDTCRCGNVCRYPPPIPVERPTIRVPSYQNLNLMCQASSVVSDRIGSNMVSPRMIGNGVQIPIPNTSGPQNLIPSNILQNTMVNHLGVQKPMHNCACVHNSIIPNSTAVQNLIPGCGGAFSSTGTMTNKHVLLEVGPRVFAQQSRSGSVTPVGRQSRANTPVSDSSI